VSLQLENPEHTEEALMTIVISVISLCVLSFMTYSLSFKKDFTHFPPNFDNVLPAFMGFVVGTIVFYFIAFMYGAPLIETITRSILWGALMSSLTVLPTILFMGYNPKKLMRVFLDRSPKTNTERVCLTSSFGAILGTWLGAIPIPLDSDKPWQVWPISCTYGALIGFVVGLALGIAWTTFGPKSSKKNDHFD